MRLALLVGARPMFVRGKRFPKVPLESGSWKIVVENRKSTKLLLYVSRPDSAEIFVELDHTRHELIDGPAHVSVEVGEGGREEYISVFAVPL